MGLGGLAGPCRGGAPRMGHGIARRRRVRPRGGSGGGLPRGRTPVPARAALAARGRPRRGPVPVLAARGAVRPRFLPVGGGQFVVPVPAARSARDLPGPRRLEPLVERRHRTLRGRDERHPRVRDPQRAAAGRDGTARIPRPGRFRVAVRPLPVDRGAVDAVVRRPVGGGALRGAALDGPHARAVLLFLAMRHPGAVRHGRAHGPARGAGMAPFRAETGIVGRGGRARVRRVPDGSLDGRRRDVRRHGRWMPLQRRPLDGTAHAPQTRLRRRAGARPARPVPVDHAVPVAGGRRFRRRRDRRPGPAQETLRHVQPAGAPDPRMASRRDGLGARRPRFPRGAAHETLVAAGDGGPSRGDRAVRLQAAVGVRPAGVPDGGVPRGAGFDPGGAPPRAPARPARRDAAGPGGPARRRLFARPASRGAFRRPARGRRPRFEPRGLPHVEGRTGRPRVRGLGARERAGRRANRDRRTDPRTHRLGPRGLSADPVRTRILRRRLLRLSARHGRIRLSAPRLPAPGRRLPALLARLRDHALVHAGRARRMRLPRTVRRRVRPRRRVPHAGNARDRFQGRRTVGGRADALPRRSRGNRRPGKPDPGPARRSRRGAARAALQLAQGARLPHPRRGDRTVRGRRKPPLRRRAPRRRVRSRNRLRPALEQDGAELRRLLPALAARPRAPLR